MSTQQKRYPIFEPSYKYRIDHINIRIIKVTRNCLDSISDSGYYQRLEYLVQHGFFDGHIFQLNKQIITLCDLAQYVPHMGEPCSIDSPRRRHDTPIFNNNFSFSCLNSIGMPHTEKKQLGMK